MLPTFVPTVLALFAGPSQMFPAESCARYRGRLSVWMAEYAAMSVIALPLFPPQLNRRLYPGRPRTDSGEYARMFCAEAYLSGVIESGTLVRLIPPNSKRKPDLGGWAIGGYCTGIDKAESWLIRINGYYRA